MAKKKGRKPLVIKTDLSFDELLRRSIFPDPPIKKTTKKKQDKKKP